MHARTRTIDLPRPAATAAALAIAALAAPFAPAVLAQDYPSKPIRFLVPFPPGGTGDTVGRVIAQPLSKALGQQVVVENRTGANTVIATELLARSPADGHTFNIIATSFTVNPAVYSKLPYDSAKDFAGLTRLVHNPLIICTNPALPVKTVKELVALAQKQPGRLDYATAGSGSPPHLATEYFKLLAKVQIVHIPYKGAGPAGADVLAGQVPISCMNLLQAMPLIRSNRLRALGVTTPKRFGALPDVPTIAEGGIDGYQFTNWYGALAPAGVPRDVLARLQGEIARILNTQEVRTRLAGEGAEVVASTPEQFSAFLKTETAKFERIIREARIRATD
jgi:tripartite-type tricarboxylate transporter receptor subunit TctC